MTGTRGAHSAPERVWDDLAGTHAIAGVDEERGSRAIIPMLAAAAMLGMINQMSLDPFMPVISRDLDVRVPLLGQVTTLAFIGAAAVSLVAGPLSDFYGKRRVLTTGVMAAGLSAAGTMLAPTFGWLLLARLLTSLSAGAVTGTALAHAGTLYHGDERRRAMSWIASGLAAGAIVGIPLLTLVASLASWRGAHTAVGVLAFLLVGLLHRYLPNDTTDGARLNLRNLVAAYTPLMRQPAILALFGSTAMRALAWVGMLTYAGAHLDSEFSLSSTEIGWVYMVGGAGYFAGTKLAGGRLGAFDPRTMSALATTCMGVLVGIALTAPTNLLTLVALITAASLAGGFGWVTLMALISTSSTTGQGTTMSLNSAMFQMGSALGALTGGLLLATGGYGLLGVGLMGSALVAALLVGASSGLPGSVWFRPRHVDRPTGGD